MNYQKTAFVFAGVGSQWKNMGNTLMEKEPIFRQAVDACDQCFRSYSGWSVTEELKKSNKRSRIHDPLIAPACICSIEIALAELLKSWGIEPDAVIGHSIGEASAAYAAGILTLSDVFRIIWCHSLVTREIRWQGLMAHVSLPESRLSEILSQYPDISAAAYNSPAGTVLSGESQHIRKIADMLSQQQIFCKILNISIPFHTPAIEPYKESVYQNIHDIQIMPMKIPIYSTLYGRIGTALDYDAPYWVEHIRKPVQFAKSVEAMGQDGYKRFVEISPHAILTESVREVFDAAGTPQCIVIPTMQRLKNEKDLLLNAVSRLVCSGYPVRLEYFQAQDKASIDRMAHLFRDKNQECRTPLFLFDTGGEQYRKHLIERLKSLVLEISDHKIVLKDDDQTNFFDAGMDSLSALRLQKQLCSELRISLPVTLIFEHPSLHQLTDFLIPMIRNKSSDLPCKKSFREDTFDLVDFIETQNNPLFGKLSGFHLCVTQQNNRKLEIQGRNFIDFASCNYLGLDYHPEVMDAMQGLIRKWGVHPSWTRLVASPAPYFELEERLAEFIKAPSVLVFPCIAMLNFGTLPILAGPDGVILCDSAAHHTVQEACQLAKAKGVTCAYFRYNDLEDLERQLKRYSHKAPVIVAVDGVYSMTARYLDLPGYSRLVKQYNAFLFVDDAHGFGIIGENPDGEQPYGYKGNGIARYFDMDYIADHIIYVTGMSKAFSSFASFIVCLNKEMKDKLRLASTYVFSGPIPVASLASSIAGLDVNEKEGDKLRLRLYKLSERLASGARGLGFEVDNYSSFPIVYVVTGNPEPTVKALNIVWERGLIVSPGIFPAVPMNHGGLRFSITAINTEAEIDQALEILEEIREKCMIEDHPGMKGYAN
ncbi:MAG: aminotransferase class I/II-fold pyridoxal phosphate-dependent enzyme [Desulfamplus sp.]|nr:aminotransferase class I/II-fold pyridoxal phosphate-dependent enzyme [Desulfamplus sp.]